MIVADTNLIASLLLAGPATAVAEAVLKKDAEWTAPALWRYELKNVLATQVRVLGLSLEDAIAFFEKAEEVMIEPRIEVDPASILSLAHTNKLSAYDAEFLALAVALKVKLITEDKGILKTAPNLALSPGAFTTT